MRINISSIIYIISATVALTAASCSLVGADKIEGKKHWRGQHQLRRQARARHEQEPTGVTRSLKPKKQNGHKKGGNWNGGGNGGKGANGGSYKKVQIRNLGNGECLQTTSVTATASCEPLGDMTQNFLLTPAHITRIVGAFQVRQAYTMGLCLTLDSCENDSPFSFLSCNAVSNNEFFTSDQGSTMVSATCFESDSVVSAITTDGNSGADDGKVDAAMPATGEINESFVFNEVRPMNNWGGNGGGW
jgi:hypothetical protein